MLLAGEGDAEGGAGSIGKRFERESAAVAAQNFGNEHKSEALAARF